MAVCVAVATGFYLSYIPVRLLESLNRLPRAAGGAGSPLRAALGRLSSAAPGKWKGAGFVGTLEGWAALYLLPRDPGRFALAALAGILAACWISGVAERELGTKDDPRIVIDEVVGYWVAAAFLPRRPAVLCVAFVLFRFFDAVKWPPYRWLERLPGGWGVVMDDVGAGVVANLLVRWALLLQPDTLHWP